jgi:hypothetical protein
MRSSEVSGIIGLEPAISHDVGAPKATPDGHLLGGIYAGTYCCYDLGHGDDLGHRDDSALVDSIRSWNQYLSVRKADILKLKETGGEIEYFIGLFLDRDCGLELEPELLGELSILGLRMSLDIYP